MLAVRKIYGLVLFCAVNALPASYYVASNGNDENPGTTPERPWRSSDRVCGFSFQPGDRILFRGGDSFAGPIRLTAEDSGNASAPLEVTTFGAGRASIVAEKETGFSATDVENLRISNLVLRGAGPTTNQGFGVYVASTLTNRLLKGLSIDSVEVSGFGQHGIMVTGATHGYEDVVVSRCSMHQNRKGGLEIAGKLPWDSKEYAHKNVTVTECAAFNNPGDPSYTQNHSGSGLVFYQVDGGRIEKSTAWNNGELCPARGGGPVGIWTCASRKVVIEYCESFGNRTQGLDGGGFDIDGGSEACILQYNYSHDNQGPGLMVYTYPYASPRDLGNVVRFNISVNDAVKSERYGGLWVRADGKNLEGLEIYNNTVVTSGPHAAYIHAKGVQASLRNNIFLSGKNGLPLRVDSEGGTEIGSIQLRNNLYWRNGAPFLVRWGSRDLTSLEHLRDQAGQESSDGGGLGAFINPEIELASQGIEKPLPGLGKLLQFRPRTIFARTQGTPHGSASGALRDFLGNQLASDRPFPLGAVGGLD